ncbi:MAG TPA: GNAT family N-acetyltransferase [Candidatus Limnocylindrales bacterium]|jgi:aminoglycoside 2'-N-acetyltransferase I
MDQRPDTDVDRLRTDELSAAQVEAIRALLTVAFGPDEDDRFTDHDWQHATGGVHFLLAREGRIVAHASVVERTLRVGDRPVRTGYVEAVATAPDQQRSGLGTLVMRAVGAWIAERYEMGALGTGSHGFYERLGWRTWRGPAFVRTAGGVRPTPEDDGFIMVLWTPASPPLDDTAPISCDWRPGDVW